MVGIDGHAGVLDQQVFQWAGFQDRLAATASEAGWRGDKPALLQRAHIQAEEAIFFFLLLSSIWVCFSCRVEGCTGSIADWGTGHRRGNHHQVFVLLLRANGGFREARITLGRAGFSCGEANEDSLTGCSLIYQTTHIVMTTGDQQIEPLRSAIQTAKACVSGHPHYTYTHTHTQIHTEIPI